MDKDHHIGGWDTQLLDASKAVPSDIIFYTDGSFPDAHRGENWEDSPRRMGERHSLGEQRRFWIQDCFVELLGAVAAIELFGTAL